MFQSILEDKKEDNLSEFRLNLQKMELPNPSQAFKELIKPAERDDSEDSIQIEDKDIIQQ